jgi:isopenicillin N synthase-like dioxygenase
METPTKDSVSPRGEAIQGAAVVLSYEKLLNGDDLTEEIERAYGADGLGILTVEGIPELSEARSNLLPLAHRFASLSDEKKDKYTIEDAFYSFGWSRGKEKLDGQFDFSKGSYYNNPQYDRPVDDEELIKKFPAFVHPNIWPTEDVPEMEAAFKALGQLIVAVGVLVSKQCDAYVKKRCASYKDNYLQTTIESSLCCKARLLHYYAKSFEESLSPHKRRKVVGKEEESEADHDPFSSWCGWHNDHGSLTGLVSAMFTDEEGNIVSNTDPDAGKAIYESVYHNAQSSGLKSFYYFSPNHQACIFEIVMVTS